MSGIVKALDSVLAIGNMQKISQTMYQVEKTFVNLHLHLFLGPSPVSLTDSNTVILPLLACTLKMKTPNARLKYLRRNSNPLQGNRGSNLVKLRISNKQAIEAAEKERPNPDIKTVNEQPEGEQTKTL
eukprot:Gb_40086 [translate_table: standard]